GRTLLLYSTSAPSRSGFKSELIPLSLQRAGSERITVDDTIRLIDIFEDGFVSAQSLGWGELGTLLEVGYLKSEDKLERRNCFLPQGRRQQPTGG
ncbi:hypothetical protein J6590_099773, partial [Homalodisca vitripennis]